MHMNMSVDKNYAIGMMVSNDPQWYDLTRREAATKCRLALLIFKENNLT
jgi:hypothetical protein